MTINECEYHYFDYAATSPMCKSATDVMKNALCEQIKPDAFLNANANSLHKPGRCAYQAMEAARKSIAQNLGAKRPGEIIFTSGATEADNGAITGIAHGLMEAWRCAKPSAKHCENSSGKGKTDNAEKNYDENANLSTHNAPTLLVSAIEHDAVLKPATHLKREGWNVVFLQPNKHGHVTPDALEGALLEVRGFSGNSPQHNNNAPLLVSVMMANSEVGSIQDVRALADVAHANGAIFHTDAVQALGKVPINLQDLGVDSASFSAHKIGGPKGVGCLYLKCRTPFDPVMLGGGQEAGLRSGTQNVPGIIAFDAAICACTSAQPSEKKRLSALRDYLYDALCSQTGVMRTIDASIDASKNDGYLPNIVHVCTKGIDSETIVLQMDKRGFAVSGGSACSSKSTKTSHVLRAIGIDDTLARGAVRISMGAPTTKGEVDKLIVAFCEVVQMFR